MASMYPNPTAGTVNIVFSNAVNSAQITIADIQAEAGQ